METQDKMEKVMMMELQHEIETEMVIEMETEMKLASEIETNMQLACCCLCEFDENSPKLKETLTVKEMAFGFHHEIVSPHSRALEIQPKDTYRKKCRHNYILEFNEIL